MNLIPSLARARKNRSSRAEESAARDERKLLAHSESYIFSPLSSLSPLRRFSFPPFSRSVYANVDSPVAIIMQFSTNIDRRTSSINLSTRVRRSSSFLLSVVTDICGKLKWIKYTLVLLSFYSSCGKLEAAKNI